MRQPHACLVCVRDKVPDGVIPELVARDPALLASFMGRVHSGQQFWVAVPVLAALLSALYASHLGSRRSAATDAVFTAACAATALVLLRLLRRKDGQLIVCLCPSSAAHRPAMQRACHENRPQQRRWCCHWVFNLWRCRA